MNLQDYQFKSDKGVFNERFTVLFEEESILGNNDTILQQISIFPNPTENIINIISPMAIDMVTIYDVRGREVYRESFTHQGSYQIDMSDLDTAMYFVKIDTQDGSITRRVVKQ